MNENDPAPYSDPDQGEFAYTAANLTICAPMLAGFLLLLTVTWRRDGSFFEKYLVMSIGPSG